jgi:hypothetical protein
MSIDTTAGRSPRSYSLAIVSGTMAAGLAADSPILAFRWNSPLMALVRRITVQAANHSSTQFAEGFALIAAYVARNFTVQDTGGGAVAWTVAGSGRKGQRFSASELASSTNGEIRASTTAALSAGTRTLDTNPFAAIVGHAGAVPNTSLFNGEGVVWDAPYGRQPIELRANEGIILQATVPATGTWKFKVGLEWDEQSEADYLAA